MKEAAQCRISSTAYKNASWSSHEAEMWCSVKQCDRSPRIQTHTLTNFVIESLHILVLTVVGAAKHGDHTCMTDTDPFPLNNCSFSALFSTVQSATSTCVKHRTVPVVPLPLSCDDLSALLQHCRVGSTDIYQACQHRAECLYTPEIHLIYACKHDQHQPT